MKTTGLSIIQMLIRVERYGTSSTLVEQGRERDLYRTRYGDLFWLNKSSCIDECIINAGIYEKESIRIINRFVKPGDIVLDVGANIGYYSVLLSKLVGQFGRVYAFEPTDNFCKILQLNIGANNLQNVEIVKMGLSNKIQELEIKIGNSSATLHSQADDDFLSKELIKLTSLDKFIVQNPLEKIDFIKLDIDGHEPLFFEGASNTLNKYNPIILLEVSHIHYLEAGFKAWDFYGSLKQQNYYIYHEHNLEEITSQEQFLIKCANFAYSSNIVITKNRLTL